jgi:ribonuclease-3
VLNLAVSHLLYTRLSALPEGDLSRVRANLVKQDTLHRLALELALSPLLRLGEGEARSGGPSRPSILADALEALIGAVYLDAGFAAAEALVRRLYESVEITPRMEAAAKDPKTELQEWLQGHKMKLPCTAWRRRWAPRTSRLSMSSARCPSWAFANAASAARAAPASRLPRLPC